MMRTLQLPTLALGVVALMVLTSCGDAEPAATDPETSPPAEGAGAATPATDVEEDNDEASGPGAAEGPQAEQEGYPPSIRDVDFAELEWTEWVNEVVLTPAEGADGYLFEVGEEVHYADVNGDGHDDAMVSLGQTEERWMEEIWYIWAWDPDAEIAYQAGGPIARGASCGDYVESVAAGEDHFIIEEYLWPENADHDCASTPSIHVTRHVVIEDDWPVMISPVRAHGGMCPQILGTDDLWPVEDFEFRTSPDDAATMVGEPEPAGFAEADVWNRTWLYYPNWMLVHLAYMNPAEGPPVIEGDYTPCGWVYLEDDTRPIPHDPYVPDE